ncbi:MAG: hypothetical protein M3178_05005 [Pseudomonadota bacterium]|nr:hypothetical protein [Pseudomonadota bacterium]
MHHAKLFLAAATVLFGSVTALWAEPLPASNSTEISTPDLGPSPITVPADSTAAPAVVPPNPVAEIAAQPQVVESGPIRRVAHAVVPPHRPVTYRARLGCFCSHPSARMVKHAIPPRVAARRAAVWLTASREPQYVLLGVGF